MSLLKSLIDNGALLINYRYDKDKAFGSYLVEHRNKKYSFKYTSYEHQDELDVEAFNIAELEWVAIGDLEGGLRIYNSDYHIIYRNNMVALHPSGWLSFRYDENELCAFVCDKNLEYSTQGNDIKEYLTEEEQEEFLSNGFTILVNFIER